MNNKGFAITGILYTIFTLFMLVLLASLSNLSFKNRMLIKSLEQLEGTFNLTKLDRLEDGFQKENEEYIAKINGKYIFKLKNTKYNEKPLTCTVYLKKGETIPNANNSNFYFIPDDCNKYEYNIKFDGIIRENTMTLTEIYQFKG